MSPYAWAWVVVGASACLLLLAFGRALRDRHAPLLKALAGWWLLAVMVVPAQIPRHTDEFAPALVVYLFEAFLQRDGSPDVAGRVLLAASLAGLVVGLGWYGVGRLLRRRVA